MIFSWSQHYNSWKNYKKNFLLLKYENLILDPEKEFSKLRNYLYKVLNLSFSNNKFLKSVETNSFQNLKHLEKKTGFVESVNKKHSEGKISFFNLGKENNFNKILDIKVKQKIENKFNDEMNELKYI